MLGTTELVFVFLIVLVLFGATRLPQLGKGLGEGISNFKRGLKNDERELGPGDNTSAKSEASPAE